MVTKTRRFSRAKESSPAIVIADGDVTKRVDGTTMKFSNAMEKIPTLIEVVRTRRTHQARTFGSRKCSVGKNSPMANPIPAEMMILHLSDAL